MLTLSSRHRCLENAGSDSIYTCTYAILFFGTPHRGSSKARVLDRVQKAASIALPKSLVQFEFGLINALRENSETLQNITDEFVPLMSHFRIFCLWEQFPTGLGLVKAYIVSIESAAPVLDGVERCAIPADHRSMCRFQRIDSPGFRSVLSALKRYSHDARLVIPGRLKRGREAG